MNRLDDIIPPSRRKDATPDAPGRPADSPRRMRGGGRMPYLTIVVALVIIALSAGALVYFSTAKVEITPNSATAAVQGSFSASQSSGNLPFQIITTSKVATQTVNGSGTKTVTSSASGQITVYNTQAKSQTLIANTRFATAAGLVFRIHSAIKVPAGTSAAPGSVVATIYADQPGASYNVGATSFTVPGLAGTPQASQVYARSTAAMTGGASGSVPVVDSATEAQATEALANALAPSLATAIANQVPQGYVLVPGSATTTYVELTPAPSATSGMVDVKEQGTATAVVFPNAALAAALAGTAQTLDYSGEPLTLASTTGLSLAFSGGYPSASAQTLAFSVSGSATFVYTVDSTRIAAAIAGKTRAAAEVALTNFPEVKRAVLILRPFWRSSFPQDPSSIGVSVGTP